MKQPSSEYLLIQLTDDFEPHKLNSLTYSIINSTNTLNHAYTQVYKVSQLFNT